MFRKTIVLFVVFFVGINASEDSDFQWKSSLDRETNGDISIISMHNTNNEIAHRPIEYVEMELIEAVNGILHYTFGARVRNDRLVASGGQNQSWPSPHNVEIQLTYPSQGYGAAVSYIAIVVNQTSALGRAYVVKGGINQHLISVVVEAYNTLVFNVFAYVYGV